MSLKITSPPACRASLGCALLTLLCCGCSATSLDAMVQRIFEPGRSAQQYMLIAVSDADPDVRREALAHVAGSKLAGRDWAIKGYIAIALLESNPQARCVAIRALTASGDPRATDTLLKILNFRDHPPQSVRPPGDLARWDATEGLAELCSTEGISDQQLQSVRRTLLEQLEREDDRHVRTVAARGLAHFSDVEVLNSLIRALRDRDFAVVHACEESLVTLTGVTNNYSAHAWQQWLAEHEADAFASAGTIPPSRQALAESGWKKRLHSTRELFRWIFPERKP